MGVRLNSRFKIQRKLGLELPGLGKPGALTRKPYPPGQHGNKRKKYSDFALRLEEKQKLRFHYLLTEKQLQHFIRRAKRGLGTNWTDKLVGLLERRLDNISFRLGLCPSIQSARQMISHGHILVNGKKVTVGSAVLKQNDKVTLSDKGVNNQNYLRVKDAPRLELPDYLRKEEDGGKPVGTVLAVPHIEHVPFPFDAGLFTEYYAAKNVQ